MVLILNFDIFNYVPVKNVVSSLRRFGDYESLYVVDVVVGAFHYSKLV